MHKKIIQALSDKVFQRELELDRNLWSIISTEELSALSRELLKEHSKRLVNWDGESHIV